MSTVFRWRNDLFDARTGNPETGSLDIGPSFGASTGCNAEQRFSWLDVLARQSVTSPECWVSFGLPGGLGVDLLRLTSKLLVRRDARFGPTGEGKIGKQVLSLGIVYSFVEHPSGTSAVGVGEAVEICRADDELGCFHQCLFVLTRSAVGFVEQLQGRPDPTLPIFLLSPDENLSMFDDQMHTSVSTVVGCVLDVCVEDAAFALPCDLVGDELRIES